MPCSLGVRLLAARLAGQSSWQDAATALQAGIATFAGVQALQQCMQLLQLSLDSVNQTVLTCTRAKSCNQPAQLAMHTNAQAVCCAAPARLLSMAAADQPAVPTAL